MTTHVSSRRSFIWTAGAALSAPVAAAAAHVPVGAEALDDPAARLAALEDVMAIRALTCAYARAVNAGDREALAALFAHPPQASVEPDIVSISTDSFGESSVIALQANGLATTRVQCTVRVEQPIEPSCTLEEMARAQGDVVRRTVPAAYDITYVKREGEWKISRAERRALTNP